jgi:hypothetical protein
MRGLFIWAKQGDAEEVGLVTDVALHDDVAVFAPLLTPRIIDDLAVLSTTVTLWFTLAVQGPVNTPPP